MKIKDEKEWMRQAEYDMDAAGKNFESGIYPYTIFLCHLSIEKALKSIYFLKLGKEPPKIHDLKTLIRILNLDIPAKMEPFVGKLTAISIPARYPDDLKQTLKSYNEKSAGAILADSKKVLKWLKKELNRK